MKQKPWNRCDACGRFIPLGDFRRGGALRKLIAPDSDRSVEEYETLCKKHLSILKQQQDNGLRVGIPGIRVVERMVVR